MRCVRAVAIAEAAGAVAVVVSGCDPDTGCPRGLTLMTAKQMTGLGQ